MNIEDLIAILQTNNGKTTVVIQQDKHVGYECNSAIDGIEEVEFNGELAILII